jgi:hypothetical protein
MYIYIFFKVFTSFRHSVTEWYNFITTSNNNKIQTIAGVNHTDIAPLAFVKYLYRGKQHIPDKNLIKYRRKLYSKLRKVTLLLVDNAKAVTYRIREKTNNICRQHCSQYVNYM